jgi:hypothetical protein
MQQGLINALEEAANFLSSFFAKDASKHKKYLVVISFGDATEKRLPDRSQHSQNSQNQFTTIHFSIDPSFAKFETSASENEIEVKIPFAWPLQGGCGGKLSPLQQLQPLGVVADRPWATPLRDVFRIVLQNPNALLLVENQVIWQPDVFQRTIVRVSAPLRNFIASQDDGFFKGREKYVGDDANQLNRMVAIAVQHNDQPFLEMLERYHARKQTFVIDPAGTATDVAFSYRRARNDAMEEMCDIPNILRDAWVAAKSPSGRAALISHNRAFLLDRVLNADGTVKDRIVSFYAWDPDADKSVERSKLFVDATIATFGIVSGVAEEVISQMASIRIGDGDGSKQEACRSDSLLDEVQQRSSQNTVPKEWIRRVPGAEAILRGVCSVETGGGGNCLFSSIAFVFNAVAGAPGLFAPKTVRDAMASEVTAATLRRVPTVLDDLSPSDIGRGTVLADALRLAQKMHGDADAPRSNVFLQSAPRMQEAIATALRARLRETKGDVCWGSVPMLFFLMQRPELRNAQFVVFDVDKGPVGVFSFSERADGAKGGDSGAGDAGDESKSDIVFGLVRVGQHFRALAPLFRSSDKFPRLVREMIRVHGSNF